MAILRYRVLRKVYLLVEEAEAEVLVQVEIREEQNLVVVVVVERMVEQPQVLVGVDHYLVVAEVEAERTNPVLDGQAAHGVLML